jgi:hypothetical protein
VFCICDAEQLSDSHNRSFRLIENPTPLRRTAGQELGPELYRRQTALVDTNLGVVLAPVSLGGQTVELVIDTGSSNIWAVASGYTCESGFSCDFGHAVNVNEAFDISPDLTFITSYEDGTNGTGLLANTSVEFGGILIQEQTVGLAETVSCSYAEVLTIDLIKNARSDSMVEVV